MGEGGLPSIWEFLELYDREEVCWQEIRQARWGEDGFRCPRCGEEERWSFIQTRDLFECNECSYQASVTSGTIMQDTKLDLRDWFLAAYLDAASGQRLHASELATTLGTGRDTAGALLDRLRTAVETEESARQEDARIIRQVLEVGR